MQHVILAFALVGLAVLAAIAIASALCGAARRWSWALAALAVGAAIHAQKPPSGPQRVNYPITDPEARYIFDSGSYVTNGGTGAVKDLQLKDHFP